MLTDNAGLIEVALAAGDASTAADAARFLVEVLQLESGGFAAAQDSESIIDGRRDEGGFYARDAAARASLSAPALDEKVVTGWNGLAIRALARAAVALDDDRLLEAARWAADAVLESNLDDDGMLRRASLDEIRSRAAATLEDYGGLASGLLALAVASGEPAYADRARALVDVCLDDEGAIAPPGGGDTVLAAHGMRASGVPTDGASPSGPSVFADAALTLWRLGAGEQYRAAAERVVAGAAATAVPAPIAHGALLEVALGLAAAPRQLVVVGDPASPLAAAARRIPADIVAIVPQASAEAFAAAGYSLFEGKIAAAGAPTAYDCRGFTCRLPVTDPAALAG
jgi:uncharacterized protein